MPKGTAKVRKGKTCSFNQRYLEYCGIHFSKYVDTTCPICLENIKCKDLYISNCNHIYHKKCIHTWLESKNTCPTCRYDIQTKDIFQTQEETQDVDEVLTSWFLMFTVNEIEQIILCFDDNIRPRLINHLLVLAVQQEETPYYSDLIRRLFYLS